VEAAVEQLVGRAGFDINHRGNPVIGSWFRRMDATAKAAARTAAGREAALTALHIADARLVQEHDGI
jgi:hypothetical protein